MFLVFYIEDLNTVLCFRYAHQQNFQKSNTFLELTKAPLGALLVLVPVRLPLGQLLVLDLLVFGGPLGLGDDAAVRSHRAELAGVLGVRDLVGARGLADDPGTRGDDGAVALPLPQHLAEIGVAAVHRRQEVLEEKDEVVFWAVERLEVRQKDDNVSIWAL